MSGLQLSQRFKDWQSIQHQEEQCKTIVQQMQDIVDEMCDKFCKWPDLWDEEAEGIELCESDICKNCPLNKLT